MSTTETRAVRAVGIDLAEDARRRLVGELVAASLELRDLQPATKVAHWNVRGIGFSHLHAFFDGLVEHLDGWVDMTTERAVMLGGYARGTSHDRRRPRGLRPIRRRRGWARAACAS